MSQQRQPNQIDRNYVRLLMIMRRFVRDEFDIKVAISEPEAAIKLLDYAERSRNKVLQEMGKELRSMFSPNSDETTAKPERAEKEKVHYYRGVAQPVTTRPPADAQRPAENKSTQQRIYRGCVVVG
ncbi:MAG: hypothetical protein ABFS08_08960 [Pseudomonadota bacterium]